MSTEILAILGSVLLICLGVGLEYLIHKWIDAPSQKDLELLQVLTDLQYRVSRLEEDEE